MRRNSVRPVARRCSSVSTAVEIHPSTRATVQRVSHAGKRRVSDPQLVRTMAGLVRLNGRAIRAATAVGNQWQWTRSKRCLITHNGPYHSKEKERGLHLRQPRTAQVGQHTSPFIGQTVAVSLDKSKASGRSECLPWRLRVGYPAAPGANTVTCIPSLARYLAKRNTKLPAKSPSKRGKLVVTNVTVQVGKTGITPLRGTSDRFREAKTELLHPARGLHMRR